MKRGAERESKGMEGPVAKKSRLLASIPVDSSFYRDAKFPNFAKPTEIGTISLDARREVHSDRSQLKYFVPRKENTDPNLDLNRGFESWITVDENDKQNINHILKWILLQSNGGLDPKSAIKDADFICFRGLFTKLGCVPYENKDDVRIAAIRHKDVIFLCEFDTEKKMEELRRRSERDFRMTYWGYMFEHYMVSDEPDGPSNIESRVDNNQAFCSVVRGRLGQHRLAFVGEVDCLDKKTGKYLELKTSRILTNPKQEQNFHKFKTLKWWIQSFLIGIEEIVVGFRDDDGVVVSVKRFSLTELAKHEKVGWKGHIPMNFIEKVLDSLKETIIENDPRKVYLLDWRPGQSDLTIKELLSEEEKKRYHFMPDWFLNP